MSKKRVLSRFGALVLTVVLLIPAGVKPVDAMSWTKVNQNGFGNSQNQGLSDFIVFNEKLYAATFNENAGDEMGTEIFRSSNGTDWDRITDADFSNNLTDNPNLGIFNGELYLIGQLNDPVLVKEYVQLFKSPTGDSDSWTKIGENGFGDLENGESSNFATFNGKLYLGIFNNAEGAQIWRSDNGTDWERVHEGGFGSPQNNRIQALQVFNGKLYAGIEAGDVGKVYRTEDGTTWEGVTTDGFGDSQNIGVGDFALFRGQIYAYTNSFTGAEVWRSDTGNPGDWEQANQDGFGNPNNNWMTAFQYLRLSAFGGLLFAGTYNLTQGGQIWVTEDGTNWSQESFNGFGRQENWDINAFTQFQGKIYVGTFNVDGTELWRSSPLNLSSWEQSNEDGFGLATNTGINSLYVYRDKLYAGTTNQDATAQIWRSGDGTRWERVTDADFDSDIIDFTEFIRFGDNIYAIAFENSQNGVVKVFRSPSGDPDTWSQVNQDDFADTKNTSPRDLAVFNNSIYISTQAEGGAQIWKSSNGTDWVSTAPVGLGDPKNYSINVLEVFGGVLYAGVEGDTQNKIFRTTNGTDWTSVVNNAFGDAEKYVGVSLLEEFGGSIYAYANALTGGISIWKSGSGNLGSWEKVSDDGFGNESNGWLGPFREFRGVTTPDNRFIVGTLNNQDGGQLYVSANGTNWAKINAPTFESSKNYAIPSIVIFGNRIYVGIHRSEAPGAEIWRSDTFLSENIVNQSETEGEPSGGSQDGDQIEQQNTAFDEFFEAAQDKAEAVVQGFKEKPLTYGGLSLAVIVALILTVKFFHWLNEWREKRHGAIGLEKQKK